MNDASAQLDFLNFITQDWRRWFAWWNLIMEDRYIPEPEGPQAQIAQVIPAISDEEWDTLTLDALELRIVQDRVQRMGNKRLAAASLGISRSTMYRILDRLMLGK